MNEPRQMTGTDGQFPLGNPTKHILFSIERGRRLAQLRLGLQAGERGDQILITLLVLVSRDRN